MTRPDVPVNPRSRQAPPGPPKATAQVTLQRSALCCVFTFPCLCGSEPLSPRSAA